jgi:hypothetical protein
MENTINLKLSLFGGAGIGLLFGIIMGTSVEPLVTTMFGALTAILAAILGLNDKNFNNAKAVRIGAFGFFCVIGAYFGLFVRSHNLLSPSLVGMKEEYLAVGYTEQQALNFITQKAFGTALYPGTSSSSDGIDNVDVTSAIAVIDSSVIKQHSSLLFSAPVELSGCDELEYTDDSLPLEEIVNNFELTGGVWETLGLHVAENVIEDRQKSILLSVKDSACQVNNVDEDSCSTIDQYLLQQSYQEVLLSIAGLNDGWKKIANSIDESELSLEEKTLSLTLVKNTLCGF